MGRDVRCEMVGWSSAEFNIFSTVISQVGFIAKNDLDNHRGNDIGFWLSYLKISLVIDSLEWPTLLVAI